MTRPDALFLSTASAFNSSQLMPVVDWFLNNLLVINAFSRVNSLFTIRALEQDQLDKQKVIRFLASADIGIKDIQIEKESRPGKSILMAPNGVEVKEEIQDFYNVSFIHHVNNKDWELSLADESEGTQRLVELAGPILDVMTKEVTLIVDELEASLHPILVEKLVQSFFEEFEQKDGAQLIFTTHCESLIDNNTTDPDNPLLRRDQIWFVNKNRDSKSTLYALSDFTVRKNENVRNAYLSGMFDGIPFIDSISVKG